jgi:predicted TIM-barrel fold metal-dependent hydrolase
LDQEAHVIDFGSTPPIPEFNPTSKEHLANYRRVYKSSEERTRAEADPEGALASYIAAYDQAGISTVVVKARDVETTFGLKIKNEDVAAFCERQGPRFIGFAGVDPHKGMDAIRELEHAVKGLGLKGLNIQCFESKVAINDAKLYPLYAKCIELDVPVNIHVGINFSTATSMEYGRPALLDEVMMHFPDLRVIASPPGWPWVTELIGVAWRHANVHIGLVAMRPKYLAVANSGYEPLLQYGNTVLQDRMIFGSAWPMQPIGQAIADIDALPLKDITKRKWLHENAARLLRLS